MLSYFLFFWFGSEEDCRQPASPSACLPWQVSQGSDLMGLSSDILVSSPDLMTVSADVMVLSSGFAIVNEVCQLLYRKWVRHTGLRVGDSGRASKRARWKADFEIKYVENFGE